MRLDAIEKTLDLHLICGDDKQEFDGVYAGDLLSWVMSHVQAGNIWITIMSNLNVIAVASLTETACVILAEGVRLEDDIISVAREKGVTVFSSDKSVYELCAEIAAAIR